MNMDRPRESERTCALAPPQEYFFPNLSELITFAAAPLVSTPLVRNQLVLPQEHEIYTIYINSIHYA